MVGQSGLEPRTSALSGLRSIAPIAIRILHIIVDKTFNL